MKLILRIILIVSFILNIYASHFSNGYIRRRALARCDRRIDPSNLKNSASFCEEFKNGMIGHNNISIRYHIQISPKCLFSHLWALIKSKNVLAFEDQKQANFFFEKLESNKRSLLKQKADQILKMQKLKRDLAEFESEEANIIASKYGNEILQVKSDIVENSENIYWLEQMILSLEEFENYFNDPDNQRYSLQNDKTFYSLKSQSTNTEEDPLTKGSKVIEPEKKAFWKFWAKK